MLTNKIIAFSGTHGTGKTTATFQKAHKLKIENPTKKITVLTETAALCPFPINTDATIQSQLWIFTAQIKAELEAIQKFDIVVSDRSIVDCIAYTHTAGFYSFASAMLEIAREHISCYQQVILLSPDNQYIYNDGIRDTEHLGWRHEIHNTLIELYQILDLQISPVPPSINPSNYKTHIEKF